jgi:hypothetical protein
MRLNMAKHAPRRAARAARGTPRGAAARRMRV